MQGMRRKTGHRAAPGPSGAFEAAERANPGFVTHTPTQTEICIHTWEHLCGLVEVELLYRVCGCSADRAAAFLHEARYLEIAFGLQLLARRRLLLFARHPTHKFRLVFFRLPCALLVNNHPFTVVIVVCPSPPWVVRWRVECQISRRGPDNRSTPPIPPFTPNACIIPSTSST